jgi:hypothetical protein
MTEPQPEVLDPLLALEERVLEGLKARFDLLARSPPGSARHLGDLRQPPRPKRFAVVIGEGEFPTRARSTVAERLT